MKFAYTKGLIILAYVYAWRTTASQTIILTMIVKYKRELPLLSCVTATARPAQIFGRKKACLDASHKVPAYLSSPKQFAEVSRPSFETATTVFGVAH